MQKQNNVAPIYYITSGKYVSGGIVFGDGDLKSKIIDRFQFTTCKKTFRVFFDLRSIPLFKPNNKEVI